MQVDRFTVQSRGYGKTFLRVATTAGAGAVLIKHRNERAVLLYVRGRLSGRDYPNRWRVGGILFFFSFRAIPLL